MFITHYFFCYVKYIVIKKAGRLSCQSACQRVVTPYPLKVHVVFVVAQALGTAHPVAAWDSKALRGSAHAASAGEAVRFSRSLRTIKRILRLVNIIRFIVIWCSFIIQISTNLIIGVRI